MTIKDFIKIIQDKNLEDYEIIEIDLDDSYKHGDIVLWKNHKILPYPEYKDFFDFSQPAEVYDHACISVEMDTGKVMHYSTKHYDSSTKELYPY